ncbi:hypothetical protein CR194_15620 [Salipaludibacillus keqinensis]|uniref:Uncharacterized protein n=1 Tax=Salipaludibacillus keqinensis TaxID=2045207 RepID=A0A323TS73_9BACI|nr:hypothetical protein [Salipaludibacillus keqinensis]PYZ92265.1 hypothetical protein CR194_15620 [Salipaludibacillus keqinensis]
MKKLSTGQFYKAVDFIMTYARPLDKKLFEYYFTNGSSISVLNELSRFQNRDGGVGHGMEPDIRMPHSSPIATSIAMQYARKVGALWGHPFVKSSMNYFTSIYERWDHWPLTLPEMSDFPRADWWEHSQENSSTFQVNPGAEIIGYYYAYPQAIEAVYLNKWRETVFDFIEKNQRDMEFHNILCYLRLAGEMSEPHKSTLLNLLRPSVEHVVTREPKNWQGYCAKPLWLAPTPDAPMYSLLEELVEINLDYEIAHQDKDGSWLPFWAWGQNRDLWLNEVKTEWQGYLTVQTLRSLQTFDRIEQNAYMKSRG